METAFQNIRLAPKRTRTFPGVDSDSGVFHRLWPWRGQTPDALL